MVPLPKIVASRLVASLHGPLSCTSVNQAFSECIAISGLSYIIKFWRVLERLVSLYILVMLLHSTVLILDLAFDRAHNG